MPLRHRQICWPSPLQPVRFPPLAFLLRRIHCSYGHSLTLQHPALKVSSLFLNIKGGFDNVDADILCSSLCSKGVNHYLISWVRSFLTGRSCRLLFQGSPRIFSPVSVCTPQGSPVSPLFFVIYVAPLHIPLDWALFFPMLMIFHLRFLLLLTAPTVDSYRRSLDG